MHIEWLFTASKSKLSDVNSRLFALKPQLDQIISNLLLTEMASIHSRVLDI
jgi:hypothetical protein